VSRLGPRFVGDRAAPSASTIVLEIAALQDGSAQAKPRAVRCPDQSSGRRVSAHQLARGERDRLATVQDRDDDVGRKKVQAHQQRCIVRAPFPIKVVATGIPVTPENRVSALAAQARAAPWPARMIGRFALRMRRAAAWTAPGRRRHAWAVREAA